MKKCIVISDSFKGSLPSFAIARLAREQVPRFFPDCEVVALPVADGGEGTVECFLDACGGEKVVVGGVWGPRGERLEAAYARLRDGTAVIEMAAAAGLPLVAGHKDPRDTTTYGVGQLIRHAAEHGAEHIILGLGGSATNDAGCGAAAALGAVFTTAEGEVLLPRGEDLGRVAHVDLTALREVLRGVRITAMCDIDNPMYGERGAAFVFGPQKGADEATVRLLDEGLRSLDGVLRRDLGCDVSALPGAGAAGAFGAGCVAFFGARLARGIEVVLDTVKFDEVLRGADLVITGEGRIDAQSMHGKVVSGVARRASAAGVPVFAIVGDIADSASEVYDHGVSAVFSINRVALPRAEAKLRSRSDYERTLCDLLRALRAAEGFAR